MERCVPRPHGVCGSRSTRSRLLRSSMSVACRGGSRVGMRSSSRWVAVRLGLVGRRPRPGICAGGEQGSGCLLGCTTSGAVRGRPIPGGCRSCSTSRRARTGFRAATPGSACRCPHSAAPAPDGIPYLAPEVQLYYKARTPRPKDEIDFAQVLPVLPVLAAGQRRWLADVITCSYGEHPWVQHL